MNVCETSGCHSTVYEPALVDAQGNGIDICYDHILAHLEWDAQFVVDNIEQFFKTYGEKAAKTANQVLAKFGIV